METSIPAQLRQLISGLIYISESEYAFDLFQWDDVSNTSVVTDKIKQLVSGEISHGDPHQFFHKLIHDQDLNDEFVKAQAEKYARVYALLKEHLDHLTMYKAGGVQKEIYITGFTRQGACIALHTTAIET